MWAYMVNRANVGPTPCPVLELTTEILAQKFSELTNEETKKNAVELSIKMNAEDGIEGGLAHFLECLPRDNICSDVGLIMGEVKIARYRLKHNEVKVGTEVAARLVPKPRRYKNFVEFLKAISTLPWKMIERRRKNWLQRHAIMTHGLGTPRTFWRGMIAGVTNCWRSIFVAPIFIYTKPDKYARSHGALGCLAGLVASAFFMVAVVLHGIFVALPDRVLLGYYNGVLGKRSLYVFDRSVRYQVFSRLSIVEELQDYPRPVGKRKAKIDEAVDIAKAASTVFESAGADFWEEHWHWRVAAADRLKKSLLPGLRMLTHTELNKVSRFLDMEGKHEISFSRFCFYIGKATQHRFEREQSMFNVQASFRDMYGSAHSGASLMRQVKP
jgi:hypothetical protein